MAFRTIIGKEVLLGRLDQLPKRRLIGEYDPNKVFDV
jgi:hypothetical protein